MPDAVIYVILDSPPMVESTRILATLIPSSNVGRFKAISSVTEYVAEASSTLLPGDRVMVAVAVVAASDAPARAELFATERVAPDAGTTYTLMVVPIGILVAARLTVTVVVPWGKVMSAFPVGFAGTGDGTPLVGVTLLMTSVGLFGTIAWPGRDHV